MKQSSIHGIDGIDVDILMASTLVEKALKAWKQGGWWRLARPFFFLPEWTLVFYLQRKVWRLPGKQWHTKQFHKQESPQAKERPNGWKQLKWCSVRESRPSLLILQCYVKKKMQRKQSREIPTSKEEKAHRSYLWSNTWIVIYIQLLSWILSTKGGKSKKFQHVQKSI